MLRAMDLYYDEECFGNESQTRGGILSSAVLALMAIHLPTYIFSQDSEGTFASTILAVDIQKS